VIGARPQIIKSAAISRIVRGQFQDRIKETLIHTGQHYDTSMSSVFFNDLGIPEPDVQLNVGVGTPSKQTARMIEGLDAALRSATPDLVLVYGDTTSTLAGTIAAGKLKIPVAHVEAGLRSYDRSMPEELNRLACDHCSTWLFCPTNVAVMNLEREGFNVTRSGPATPDDPTVILSGDVMYDNSLYFSDIANERSTLIKDSGLAGKEYILATVHRAKNTDDPERLNAIFTGSLALYEQLNIPVVLPLHPRTRRSFDEALEPQLRKAILASSGIHILPPVGYLDMLALEQNARLVVTDSGGVQKEAYFFGKPCVILRAETEWVEIVETGRALLADADPDRIMKTSLQLLELADQPMAPLFGDGHAAEKICEELLR
ncbi:MAG: UDP-N-acetylglucosamine 2-epimerase (non-hydrolyzing), partial [Flavobacteriales bacterium]|nr:UDP-N-acetylglucosamine 2-epimerase (non-hydrolyzing) [Flavobacteriales bacterium]